MPEETKNNQELLEKTHLTDGLDEQALMKKVMEMPPEEVIAKVERLNKRVQFSGSTHEVQVVADPRVSTWSCARVPRDIAKGGKEVRTTDFVYIVTLPFHHLGIEDEEFILGELTHEIGHAHRTDWRATQRLNEYAQSLGYNPRSTMGTLTNCLEDPHMENIEASMSPLHVYKRKWFWAKNKAHILPNIGNNLAAANPVSQFALLLKLHCLWEIHEKDAEADEILRWDGYHELNPDVIAAWEKVKSTVEQIVGIGEAKKPIVRGSKIEKLIKSIIWPEFQALIDKYGQPPEEPEEGEDGEPGDGEGGEEQEGQEGEGEGGEPGESGDGEPGEGEGGEPGDGEGKPDYSKIKPEGSGIGDPEKIENLPPEVQAAIEKYLKERKQQIEAQTKKQLEDEENRNAAKKKLKDKKNAQLRKLDGLEPEEREKYNELLFGAKPIVSRIKKTFERYFPKVSFPRFKYGRKGKKYVPKKHIKAIGTGFEMPFASPNIPEKASLVLQIYLDVSGSMYSTRERIDETLKSIVGILEASKEYPVHMEVLAYSDSHGGMNNALILKDFKEQYSGNNEGRIISRIVKAYTNAEGFGGGNSADDAVLDWGIPRIVKKKKKMQQQYEKVASLATVLTDVEMDDQQSPDKVDEMRKLAPIIGGIIGNEPKIKQAVQKRFGPIGDGSFCPETLMDLPIELENIIRQRVQMLFK